MTEDQVRDILSGEKSFPMYPQDYLNALADEDEKKIVQDFYGRLNRYLHFLSVIYKIEADIPVIKADPVRSISATARINRAGTPEIIIGRGILDFVSAIRKKTFIFPDGDGIIVMEGVHNSELMEFWIVAHEYFHYARGHLFLPSAERQVYSWGFEFDADNLATAALYRWSTELWDEQRYVKQKYCLVAIWFCLRTIGEISHKNSKKSTHPEWQDRIRFSTRKLAHADLPHLNGRRPTAEMDAEEKRLISFAAYCEKMFMVDNNLPASTFVYWIENIYLRRTILDVTPEQQWEKIHRRVAEFDLIIWPGSKSKSPAPRAISWRQ